MNNRNWRVGLFALAALGLVTACILVGFGAGQEAVSSQAYVGHETEADFNQAMPPPVDFPARRR